MEETKLIFAPLIRVSTEAQERQGESLRTQREQLSQAVEALGGKVYSWYAGQEHATPEYERKILEQLMADAQAGKFNAVIVADLSRWSRDNEKSKPYTRILRELGIRFFEGMMEIDLYNPSHSLILGMGVEIQEFFASQQTYKSVINRIARAKQGAPACGKRPYGRLWDKATKTWKVDQEKQAKIQKIAKLYLEGDYSFNRDLGPMFGMNGASLHKTLCYRCGDTWEQRFISKRHGIDETVIIKIPRLLSEETIQAIREKSEARNSWDKQTQKHPYLFARIIFDVETGKALTGTCNSKGVRYYKPYHGCKHRYQVNADVLERAVLSELFEVIGCKVSLREAVFSGSPIGKVADKIRADLQTKRDELAQVERQLESFVTAIGNSDDVASFMDRIKPRLIELEARSKVLKDQIASLDYQLATLPSDDEIEAKRSKWAGLLEAVKESYLSSGLALENLPFEARKKIIRFIFGGKDETARRYGVYIQHLGGKPKKYSFEAYGKLGAVTGSVESRTGKHMAYADNKMVLEDNPEISERISMVILDDTEVKGCVSGQRHAHHRLGLHQ